MAKIKALYIEHEILKSGKQNIYYHIVDNFNTWKWYTDKNVPKDIVNLFNKNNPVKTWESIFGTGTKVKTFAYRF